MQLTAIDEVKTTDTSTTSSSSVSTPVITKEEKNQQISKVKELANLFLQKNRTEQAQQSNTAIKGKPVKLLISYYNKLSDIENNKTLAQNIKIEKKDTLRTETIGKLIQIGFAQNEAAQFLNIAVTSLSSAIMPYITSLGQFQGSQLIPESSSSTSSISIINSELPTPSLTSGRIVLQQNDKKPLTTPNPATSTSLISTSTTSTASSANPQSRTIGQRMHRTVHRRIMQKDDRLVVMSLMLIAISVTAIALELLSPPSRCDDPRCFFS